MKTISIPKISLAGKDSSGSSGSAPKKIKLPDGMKFGYSSNLDILANVDTSEMTNMSSMFRNVGLTALDLTAFDTSLVTNMTDMFNGCQKLTALDLSSFNTPLVTLMDYMFFNCTRLVSLDLSLFDTSSLRFFNRTFNNCPQLGYLLLGPNFFKSAGATSIDFSACSAWVGDTVVTSLVTNSYDRATAGLGTLTIKLHANTKAALTDEQIAAITAKGYTIA